MNKLLETNDSVRTASQKKKFYLKDIKMHGGLVDLEVSLGYDGNCSNGHNTFSVTGITWDHGKYESDRNTASCGAMGEDIGEVIPEFAHLDKWHLMSSDEPLHSISNTSTSLRINLMRYLLGACSMEGRIRVGDGPLTFNLSSKMVELLLSLTTDEFKDLEVIEVPHKKEPETYTNRYKIRLKDSLAHTDECEHNINPHMR